MVRAVLYLFLAIILISFLRSVFSLLAKAFRPLFDPVSRPAATGVSELPATAELKRDPVCGTYVSTLASVQRTVGGQVLHFCSTACSEKYQAPPRAVSGSAPPGPRAPGR